MCLRTFLPLTPHRVVNGVAVGDGKLSTQFLRAYIISDDEIAERSYKTTLQSASRAVPGPPGRSPRHWSETGPRLRSCPQPHPRSRSRPRGGVIDVLNGGKDAVCIVEDLLLEKRSCQCDAGIDCPLKGSSPLSKEVLLRKCSSSDIDFRMNKIEVKINFLLSQHKCVWVWICLYIS